jgi:hypothetical protein
MSLIWTFQINGVDHKAEWNRGAMRCTYEPTIVEVDRLIAEGYKLRCGSSTNMVDPTLQNEAGAFAAITAAVQFLGDYGSLSIPTSMATIVSDVVMPDAIDKAQSFGGNRSAAGQYAARVRWGNRGPKFDPLAVPMRTEEEMEPLLQAMYPQGHNTFTDAEEEAISRYQFFSPNSRIRSGELTDQDRQTIDNLDSAFSRAVPLTHDIIVTRGIPFGYRSGGVQPDQIARDEFFKGLQVGQSFSDKGYSSTTYENQNYWASSGNMLEIVVPKGTKVLPFRQMHFFSQPDTSRSRMEKEILLPRDSKFKVLATRDEIRPSGDKLHVLTVVLEQ